MTKGSTGDGSDDAAAASGASFISPLELHYDVTAGHALSAHLRALGRGEFLGMRCPRCKHVYVPPLGCCSLCAIAADEPVRLPDSGTVLTFCLVNIPVRGQGIELPFACANVVLDGADTPFLVLLQGCPVGEVRAGMRVRAVWKPADALSESMDSIEHFEPLEEADRDVDLLQDQRRRERGATHA